METRIIRVQHLASAHDPAIHEGVVLLRAGKIIAFPTETVYGLGANALDPMAVAEIFRAKGRPSNNPLIVHVDSIKQAKDLVSDWPEEADRLAAQFWPGPLTLVLPKASKVTDVVTAGGSTVALRCPAHPVALNLIRQCGFPVAAPSANRSNFISPTTAAHVARSLGGRIPLIIDGGACHNGIESTVLSLVGEPRILRPGTLTAKTLGLINGAGPAVLEDQNANTPLVAPGQLPVHYAPSTPLLLVEQSQFRSKCRQLLAENRTVGLIAFSAEEIPGVPVRQMPQEPLGYAQELYSALHEMDDKQLDAILCELPPPGQEWIGVHDRLMRAGRQDLS